MNTTTAPRRTKNCQEIEQVLGDMGHASNAEILSKLRRNNPLLSATTVHRATARLQHRGSIALAPPAVDGSMRYDSNVSPHDHFMCNTCGMLRDTDIKEKVIPVLVGSMTDCVVSGRLTISGECKKCRKDKERM